MNRKDIATLIEQVAALAVQVGTAIMEVYEGL
jgi:hypothetical protein